MRKVLIADTSQACTLLQAIFESRLRAICSTTFKDFVTALENEQPDVVVCGCHFDDGRMYDVLRHLRNRTNRIPFVAVRVLSGGLDSAVYEGVKIATRALDGDAFVDLFRWEMQYGSRAAQTRLAELVVSLIDTRHD